MEENAPPRTPKQSDLVSLCAALNAQGALYVVVGGMAMIRHGFLRATEDVDLLLEKYRDIPDRLFLEAKLRTKPND